MQIAFLVPVVLVNVQTTLKHGSNACHVQLCALCTILVSALFHVIVPMTKQQCCICISLVGLLDSLKSML